MKWRNRVGYKVWSPCTHNLLTGNLESWFFSHIPHNWWVDVFRIIEKQNQPLSHFISVPGIQQPLWTTSLWRLSYPHCEDKETELQEPLDSGVFVHKGNSFCHCWNLSQNPVQFHILCQSSLSLSWSLLHHKLLALNLRCTKWWNHLLGPWNLVVL